MAYPVWWNKTITLYNKLEATDGSVIWERTAITDCFFAVKSERVVSGDNIIVSPVFVVRIQPGKLIQANTGDIVVLSDVDDIIDETQKGLRSSDLLSKYGQSAFLVRVYKDNTGVPTAGLPHYYIGV